METSNLSRSYAATLGEIITKSNIGRQQFTPDETRIAIGVWYEVLFGVVPEHRLNDCYLHAIRNRQNTFGLAPTELCMAWNEIRQSEMHRQNPVKRLTHGFCEKCNNTGTEIVRKEGLTSARPCNH